MTIEFAPIGKYVESVSKWDPRNSNSQKPFFYIDLSSVDKERKIIQEEQVSRIVPSEAPSRARQITKKNDVLVATVRPNLNGVALVQDNLEDATASTGYCVLRTNNELNSRYLYYWVQTPEFIRDMIKKSTGANYPAVSDKTIKESLFPYASPQKQKGIVAILDKADAIRRKQLKVIDLADEFLRSMFLDMFGDPIKNPMGWDLQPVSMIADVTTGNTPSRKEPDNYGAHLEWIKSNNINTPHHFLTKAEEYLSKKGLNKARTVPKGSILLTCIAGSKDCIGNAAIADRKVSFNQQINALTPNENSTTEYIYSIALFGKKIIQSASTNGMKGMVSKGNLEKLEIPLPPIELQNDYSIKFKQYLHNRKCLEQAKQQSNNLFNSLSQQAFAGKL